MTPAYILAGGASSRFGTDKARAHIDGHPVIARIADALTAAGCEVRAVAARAGEYDDLGVAAIPDRRPGLGPLAGLDAALSHRLANHGDGWILLFPCDMLRLECAWIDALAIAEDDTALARSFRDDRWQAIPGAYHTDLLQHINDRLDAGRLSMQSLLEDHGRAVQAPPSWDPTVCFNTPDAFKRGQTR